VVLLLLQQNRKYEAVNIFAYLPRLGIAVKPNGKCGRVTANSMVNLEVAV
jgi:hypothetical protein